MSQDKSLAFRLAYLLGGRQSKLKATFPEDYAESEDTKLFENYADARELRLFCKFRNSVLLDFAKYNKGLHKSLEAFDGITLMNISYLHGKDLKINKLFYALNLEDYFNMLTDIIDTLVYKILLDMDIPEIFQEFFKFPKMSLSEIAMLAEAYGSIKSPLGICLYDAKKVKVTLKYTFNNNLNCFTTVHTLKGSMYHGDGIVPTFEMRNMPGVDLDEESSAKIKVIIEHYKHLHDKPEPQPENIDTQVVDKHGDNSVDNSVDNPMDNIEDTTITEAKPNEKREIEMDSVDNPVDSVDNSTAEVIKLDEHSNLQIENSQININVNSNKTILIVDCLNTDLLTFICLVKKSSNVDKVVLINDTEQNYLWNILKYIVADDVDIENIESKGSSIDVALTVQVCKYAYQYGVKNIAIMTNSNTCYPIFDVVEGVDFTLYQVKDLGFELELQNKGRVQIENVSQIADKFMIALICKDIINYSILYYVLNNPLSQYNDDNVLKFIWSNLSFISTVDGFDEMFKRGKENITVTLTEKGVKVANNEYAITN